MPQKLNSSGELQNYDASNGQYAKDNVNVINTESVVSFKSNKYLTDEEKAEKERRKQENLKKQREQMIAKKQRDYPNAKVIINDNGDIIGFETNDKSMMLILTNNGYTWQDDYSKQEERERQEQEEWEKKKQQENEERKKIETQNKELGYDYDYASKEFFKRHNGYVEHKNYNGKTYYSVGVVEFKTLDEVNEHLKYLKDKEQKKEIQLKAIEEEKKSFKKLSDEEKGEAIRGLSMETIEELYSDDALYNDVEYDQTSGYSGYSMSNRAVASYENGQKPMTKWSKEDILEVVGNNNYYEFTPILKKIPQNVLKENLLEKASWHHTSKMYNATNFYGVVSPQKIAKFIKEYNNSKLKIID